MIHLQPVFSPFVSCCSDARLRPGHLILRGSTSLSSFVPMMLGPCKRHAVGLFQTEPTDAFDRIWVWDRSVICSPQWSSNSPRHTLLTLQCYTQASCSDTLASRENKPKQTAYARSISPAYALLLVSDSLAA